MEANAAVARAALDWFAATPAAQRKLPSGREWAVLAAFVLYARGTGACRVLAAATGNKCVGRRELNADGLVVNDCHAEVLAHRALLRYLYTEAAAFYSSREASASIFKWKEATQRLVLRAEYSLHLYISEAPCGDAAIYALRDDVVDELVSRRAEREQQQQRVADARTDGAQQQHIEVERSALRLTGAKTRHLPDHRGSQDNDERAAKRARQETGNSTVELTPNVSTSEQKFAQLVGVARVKSGRSDLPPDKQTLSMSCSDKIAKWSVVGVQGSLLLRFFEPIFLSSIVVPRDPRAASSNVQLEAMQRAVVTRLKSVVNLPSASFPSCQCAIVTDESLVFDRSKSSSPSESLQPSPLALNWTRHESHWVTDIKEITVVQEVGIDQRWLGKFLQAADVEVLMAATGLRQGAKKVSKLDRADMERVASRLAKRNFFRAFCVVHQLADKSFQSASEVDQCDSERTNTQDPLQLTYQQAKERIVSTSASSSSPGTDEQSSYWSAYLHRRQRFASEFQGWVGVPSEWKSFTL